MSKNSKKIEFNNLEIVAVVLFLLGGDTKPVHEEDVAIKCYELFPEKFSWKKYPQFPDKMTPLFALEAGRKSENDNIIEGNTKTGFILTTRGLDWLDGNKSKVELLTGLSTGTNNTDQPKITLANRAKGSVFRNLEGKLLELKKTEAYQKFTNGRKEEIDVYDFHRFMGINEYVPKRKYEDRFQEVKVLTEKDKILKDLVIFLHSKFKDTYQKP
jgi:hypothetical protein